MKKSTQGKVLPAPQTQENIHLESATSWLPENQTVRNQRLFNPTAEANAYLKCNLSEQIL